MALRKVASIVAVELCRRIFPPSRDILCFALGSAVLWLLLGVFHEKDIRFDFINRRDAYITCYSVKLR